MLSGEVSSMFLLSLVVGNASICAVLQLYNEGFGTIRNKKRKLDAIICTFFIIGFMLYSKGFSGEMDMPGILSMRHEEMRGIVIDYKIELGKGGKNTVDVEDDKTGKVFRFSYVEIPTKLQIGDSVKMCYLKHNRTGAIVEINGEKMEYYVYHFGEYSVGIALIVILLLSMPFYYLWIYKLRSVIGYKLIFKVYTYHDIYIKAIKILYLFMIQTAVVLIIAVRGDYKTSWDWYWGLLLIVDYAGVLGLSFLRQKQFIIVKDKFYYCNFKKRVEGDLSEIENVEKTGGGVIIRTKKEEMEVFCTSKRHREALLNKLA